MSLHPIADKTEVSVDFPDKAYMGSFGRHSQFDAYADIDNVAIKLVRPGERQAEIVRDVIARHREVESICPVAPVEHLEEESCDPLDLSM